MFLIGFLLNGFLAVCLFASANGDSSGPCLPELVKLSSLNGGFDFSFDDRFPPFRDSLRSELPKVYSEIRQLIQATPSIEGLFLEAAARGASYSVLIEETRKERNRIARELRRIANGIDKESRKALRSMERESRKGRDPGIQRGESEKALHWKAMILGFAEEFFLEKPEPTAPNARHYEWKKYLRIKASLSASQVINQASFENGRQWLRFSNWAYRISSIWGELRVAVLVPSLKATNIRFQQLGGNQRGLPRYALNRISVPELDIELDLLLQWDSKSTWGEVKTLRKRLELESRSFTRVKIHAEKLIRLRDTLAPVTQIQFFFVNGITPEAKTALEALGVGVY